MKGEWWVGLRRSLPSMNETFFRREIISKSVRVVIEKEKNKEKKNVRKRNGEGGLKEDALLLRFSFCSLLKFDRKEEEITREERKEIKEGRWKEEEEEDGFFPRFSRINSARRINPRDTSINHSNYEASSSVLPASSDIHDRERTRRVDPY